MDRLQNTQIEEDIIKKQEDMNSRKKYAYKNQFAYRS